MGVQRTRLSFTNEVFCNQSEFIFYITLIQFNWLYISSQRCLQMYHLNILNFFSSCYDSWVKKSWTHRRKKSRTHCRPVLLPITVLQNTDCVYVFRSGNSFILASTLYSFLTWSSSKSVRFECALRIKYDCWQ